MKARHIDPLHERRAAKTHQSPRHRGKAEQRLLFNGFQHGAIRGLLTRHGTYLGRFKLAVEAQGDEDVVGSHQPIHPLVDLVTAEGMVEATLQTGAKMGHHCEGVF